MGGLAIISKRSEKRRGSIWFFDNLVEEVLIIFVSVLVVSVLSSFIPGRVMVTGKILNLDFGDFFFSFPKQLGPRQVPTRQKGQYGSSSKTGGANCPPDF